MLETIPFVTPNSSMMMQKTTSLLNHGSDLVSTPTKTLHFMKRMMKITLASAKAMSRFGLKNKITQVEKNRNRKKIKGRGSYLIWLDELQFSWSSYPLGADTADCIRQIKKEEHF